MDDLRKRQEEFIKFLVTVGSLLAVLIAIAMQSISINITTNSTQTAKVTSQPFLSNPLVIYFGVMFGVSAVLVYAFFMFPEIIAKSKQGTTWPDAILIIVMAASLTALVGIGLGYGLTGTAGGNLTLAEIVTGIILSLVILLYYVIYRALTARSKTEKQNVAEETPPKDTCAQPTPGTPFHLQTPSANSFDDYDKLALDMARSSQDSELERVKTLRERAYTLLQISLVVVSLFATISSVIVTNKMTVPTYFSRGLVAGIGCMMVSVGIQYYITLPRPMNIFDIATFDERNGNLPLIPKLDLLTGTLFSSYKQMRAQTSRNTKVLAVSIAFLAVGTFIMFILSLLLALSNVG